MRKLPCVTPLACVEIRGVYGQPVFEVFQQVRAILALNASDKDLSQFFAEPQVNAAKGEIYWYSDVQGPVQPYFQLNAEAREVLDEYVMRIRQRIRDVGERFASGGGAASGNRTEMFRAMMSATDLERCLFLVGTQPVLCEWGCKPIGEGANPVDLWSYAPAATEPVKAVQPIETVPLDISQTQPARAAATAAENEHDHPPASIGELATLPPTPAVKVQDEDSPASVPEVVPSKPAATNKFVPAQVAARPSYLPPGANALDRDVRGSSSDAPRYGYVDSNSRSFDFWDLLKKLIIAALLIVLVLLLVRGCSNDRSVLHDTHALESQQDETRLRKEITELRVVAAGVLANCPVGK
jgi:hypothetical protein